MKQGDIVGLVLVLGMLGGLAALFVFAPERSEIAFAPLEVPGSALVLVEASEPGVIVDTVMGNSGFITIHKFVGAAPGPFVGVSDLLEEGVHQAFAVSVSGGLSAMNDYVMLMIADDGDRVYEPGVDRPVMVDGQVIRVPVSLVSDELAQ